MTAQGCIQPFSAEQRSEKTSARRPRLLRAEGIDPARRATRCERGRLDARSNADRGRQISDAFTRITARLVKVLHPRNGVFFLVPEADSAVSQDAAQLVGLAAITLALGVDYWLVRERDDRFNIGSNKQAE